MPELIGIAVNRYDESFVLERHDDGFRLSVFGSPFVDFDSDLNPRPSSAWPYDSTIADQASELVGLLLQAKAVSEALTLTVSTAVADQLREAKP